jgi:hypothetical protein
VRKIAWTISLLLVFTPPLLASTREEQRPDREMLRLMDLLRDWDIIKDLDLIRQMDAMDRAENNPVRPASQRDPRGKVKDGQK